MTDIKLNYKMKQTLFLLTLLFSVATYSQQEIPTSIYGTWVNQEGEFLQVKFNNSFVRVAKDQVKARGFLELAGDKLYVTRVDVDDAYGLCFYVGNETLVVCKPDSEQSWLFEKIE